MGDMMMDEAKNIFQVSNLINWEDSDVDIENIKRSVGLDKG